MDTTSKKTIDNKKSEDEIKEDAKNQALEKLKQKVVIVNINDIAEAEARKAADAYMTEDKGKSNIFKKFWKHTFVEGYFRQKEINKVREEIKNTDNIYTGRIKDDNKVAHENTMQAITDRFSSEYEDTLSDDEEKKTLDDKDPESLRIKTDIKKLISQYAKGALNEEVFKNEKTRILDNLNKKDKVNNSVSYADNLFELAKNARIAVEHGAKMEELELDTNIIIGKATSSLKTEAHFNNVDKIVDRVKKTKIGQIISPTALATSIGLAYSLSVGIGAKVLRSKAAAYGTFGAAVAVSSALAGMNESQRVTAERAQHAVEMAEGSQFEEGSKKREQMEKYQYNMVSSKDLSSNLHDLIYQKDANGKETLKDIKPEDLEKIFASLANIDARRSLNSEKKIDLISYSGIGNVEKESTELIILEARAKVELRKKIESDFKDGIPDGDSFDSYLAKQTEIVQNSLLRGQGEEKGIDTLDKEFKKFKTKEVAKKIVKTAVFGLVIGATVQEGVAFFKDDTQGMIEGMLGHTSGHAVTQTPLEHLRGWLTGHPSHMGMGNAVESHLNGNTFKLPEGTSIIQNSDGTYDILKGDQVISDHIPLHFDANHNLDSESISRLGEDGIVSGTSHTVIDSTQEVNSNADDYINNHQGGTHQVHRLGWWDNDTPKPVFDLNEQKLQYVGVGGNGIDANGNYVLGVSHMTSGGSFHNNLSVDAQEQIKKGALKIAFSLTRGTQHQVFEVPIDANGNAVIDPHSEIGKLFFSAENGHAVFKGRFAEVIQSFGEKDGVEQIKSLATLEGPGNDAIHDVINTHVDNAITNLDLPLETQPPMFLPLVSHNPLEKLKEKEGFIYDESYLDRDSIYEDATYLEEPISVSYEDENYLDGEKYLDQEIVDKKGKKLSKEGIEKNLGEMKNYIDTRVDIKTMEELNAQIKEPMDNKTRMSVVLPCYHEGENVYKTLVDWTAKQKDLKPEELEIITFVNAPDKNQKLDEKTISEIMRFKKEYPEYRVQLVKYNFDFKSNRKMGAIYKMPTDLAVYRNMKRLENKASEEIVSSHLLRSGGADALGRNPRFLREIIDFMDNHPETEQLRTQSTYPSEVREKFPLFNLITVFNHTLSQLYTKGNSNIGLGTYRARAYALASGFDPSREYREEIDLGMRIRSKVGRNKNAITKLVKKNAIDNPRRELFALANGDTVLRAYNNFSKPEKDKELRLFDWNKDLSGGYKNNMEMNQKNITREFDAYFQHFLPKIERESGTVSQIISGELNEKSIKSSNIHPETRALLQTTEGLNLIQSINEKRKNGEKITKSSEEVKKLSEFITRRLFDRILLLTFGFKKGFDYDYEKLSDNKSHIVFKKEAVDKTKKMAENKWRNFDGYWKDDSSKKNIKPEKTQNIPETNKTKEIISSDSIKEIIKNKIGGLVKIEKLDLSFKNGKLEINGELSAGVIGGKIKIDGTLENSNGNIVVNKDLKIEARGYIKSRIENNLSKLVPEMKKYFEDEYSKEVISMKIENGALSLGFKK